MGITAAAVSQRFLRVLALPAYRRRALNPFQALLYDEVSKLNVEVGDWSFWRALWQPCDIWHLHHPDTVIFPRRAWQSAIETCLLRVLLSWARLRGIRIIWTVHDLDSSDGVHPRIERWFWSFFLLRLDAFICLTEAGRELALQRFPALQHLPSYINPHGDFSPAYPNTVSREKARQSLELSATTPTLLNFGLIRPYKDVPMLVETVRRLDPAQASLLVAGRVVDPSVTDDILARAGAAPHIHLHLKWVSFEDTQRYFVACDLVVLPYRRILNSGTVMLALAFRRPVLVPDRGTMHELQKRFGKDWIRLYKGDLDETEIMAALEWAGTCHRAPLDLADIDWPSIARQTRLVYDALFDSSALAVDERRRLSQRLPVASSGSTQSVN
jgi:glycosyltransferase involved in cell wall biosynthesis